jgi:hypothetical protein
VYGYGQRTKTWPKQTDGSKHVFVLLCYGRCTALICFGLLISQLGINFLEMEQLEVTQIGRGLRFAQIGRGEDDIG